MECVLELQMGVEGSGDLGQGVEGFARVLGCGMEWGKRTRMTEDRSISHLFFVEDGDVLLVVLKAGKSFL